MTPIYTYANFKTRVNAGIKNKIGILVSDRDTLNQAARTVISDIDKELAKTFSYYAKKFTTN